MGPEKLDPAWLARAGNKEMVGETGAGSGDAGTGFGDLVEDAHERVRVAGKLDRGGIREVLALTADCALEKGSEKQADQSHGEQGKADGEEHQEEDATADEITVAVTTPENLAPDGSYCFDPGHESEETEIEAHVAIEQMPELVSHESLKLVTRELLEGTSRDQEGSVLLAAARRRAH